MPQHLKLRQRLSKLFSFLQIAYRFGQCVVHGADNVCANRRLRQLPSRVAHGPGIIPLGQDAFVG